MTDQSKKDDSVRQAALDYHEFPKPGKLEIRPTNPLTSQRDLARAYSPGVAEACLEIKDDPSNASRFTARSNLVGVVSNGSAVLGLGNIGPLAAKPVMEGKAVLFKKFANIDCFDIEVNETDPEKLVDVVAALEPTFGAINLEDIKAPDCFIVEKLCRERMNIPVFHDDQHGTAIVVGAAVTNACQIANKKLAEIKVVSTGGGAAGIACLNMLIKLGVKRENVWLCDIEGLVYEGRKTEMTPQKADYAQKSKLRSLDEVIEGADLFLGLSGPGVLSQSHVKKMAKRLIILALANPTPEILPEEVREVAPDAIIATGRSDYPNQVNNVLCFPFIFRGALDVGATEINDEMQIACVNGIAELARLTSSAEAAEVYKKERLTFGADYLIPKPFDSRLMSVVASAVAQAAMRTSVATRPIVDIEAYKEQLNNSVIKSSLIMRPIYEAARNVSSKLIFAEAEDERVLRATKAIIDEMSEEVILIGRNDIIAHRIERAGLDLKIGDDFVVINPEDDPRYRRYWEGYHRLLARRGVTPDLAKTIMRTNTTAIGAMAVKEGDADCLIAGTFGQYSWHLKYIDQVLSHHQVLPNKIEGALDDCQRPTGALSLMILENEPIFVADTQVHHDPTPEQVALSVIGMARHIRRFGEEPKISLCSQSLFGNQDTKSGRKMRAAMAILDQMRPDFLYDGEMTVEAALDYKMRKRFLSDVRFEGRANGLVFSNTDSAGAVRNILKTTVDGLEVGPILMGMGNKAHIVAPSITVRGLLNIAAIGGVPVEHYG